MSAAAFASPRPGRDLFHRESRLAQQFGKGGVGSGGPDGQDARWLQGSPGGDQAPLGIEPVVAGAGQSLGSVIHIEQDGIVSLLFRF